MIILKPKYVLHDEQAENHCESSFARELKSCEDESEGETNCCRCV